jgi:hypothetical protein
VGRRLVGACLLNLPGVSFFVKSLSHHGFLWCYPIILDLESNQTIWTDYAQNYGYPTNYFWSPDSHYFGYYFPLEGIHIIDIHSKEIVMQLPGSADIVVWVAN